MALDSARSVVTEFRAQGYEPEGYTLNAYAAVQAFAAAAGAGSTDGRQMADWLHANPVATVLGDIAWDQKGDLMKSTYTWFLWGSGGPIGKTLAADRMAYRKSPR
jgi:branched-chain amino acid transport system substrate-binding protein